MNERQMSNKPRVEMPKRVRPSDIPDGYLMTEQERVEKAWKAGFRRGWRAAVLRIAKYGFGEK